jgi:adenine-specific DNA-methyltransferase
VPDLENSIDFDTAENVFIEGDNLEVLKLLQKAYNDRVKLIYIDPPYNTGNDFVYNDDFTDGLRGYLEYTGQLDEEGNRTASDVEKAGRRHSRWLNMMYPRLVLARNLLSQDGGIFVSIDFNEVHNLRSLMNEVFGEEAFQREIVWRIGWLSGYKTMANNFIRNHDTMLFFGRSGDELAFRKQYIRNEQFKPLVKADKNVREKLGELGLSADGQKSLLRFINHENRPDRYPIEDTWNSNEYDDLNSIAIVSFSGEKVSKLLEIDEEYKGQKSVAMLRRVVESMTSGDDLVMDFFAGSGSTAHAVFEANAADGGRRRTISVNLPEPLPESSSARLVGIETVTDIAIRRIKKVMPGITGAGEAGLRVYRLGDSNFRVGRTSEDELDLSESTLETRNAGWDAVAAEILLKEGVPLDEPWQRLTVAGTDVVLSGAVAVVLSLEIDDELVSDSLALDANVVVFLEDGFQDADAVKVNAVTNARILNKTIKTV